MYVCMCKMFDSRYLHRIERNANLQMFRLLRGVSRTMFWTKRYIFILLKEYVHI